MSRRMVNAKAVIYNEVLGELRLTKLEMCEEIEAFFKCFPDTVYGTPNFRTLRSLGLAELGRLYSQCLEIGLGVKVNSEDPINPEGTIESNQDSSEDPTQP